MPGFKKLEDLKWYLYISMSKLRVLYEQIYKSEQTKKTRELTVKLGVLEGSGGSESQQNMDRDDMLRLVLAELEARSLVGTLEEPKDYFKGFMPMRWGFYNDYGVRGEGEAPLVYFGGFDGRQKLLVGLGGSSRHVVGCDGMTSTHSRSNTPTLTKWLMSEFARPELPEWKDTREEDEVYEAMALAQHYLRPPTQELEFLAKTLAVGEVDDEQLLGAPRARALLGTPIFVAQAHPLPDDKSVGLGDN